MTSQARAPAYTLGEELVHAITHGLGLVASIAGLAALVIAASLSGDAWHVVGAAIFGTTLVLLYTASTFYHGISAPSPSLVKALLVNGARAIEPSGSCDYDFEVDASVVHRGWGLVQADASLYGPTGTPGARDLMFENEEHALATGGTHQVDVTVAAGDTLKVTLVWTDAPAAPAAGSPLVVNDLDLEVSGAGDTYLGNNFVGDWSEPRVPAVAETPAENDVPDRFNVVENVYIQSAGAGTYTITVAAYQVSQDQEPDVGGVEQDFSLVWSTESLDYVPLPEPRVPAALFPGLFLVGWLSRRPARR